MNENLTLYVKPSYERPWYDRLGVFTAPGCELVDLGTILKGPVPIGRLKDGRRWRAVIGITEFFGRAMCCPAQAYLVDYHGQQEVVVSGAQLGLVWGGQAMPYVWVAPDMVSKAVRKALGV